MWYIPHPSGPDQPECTSPVPFQARGIQRSDALAGIMVVMVVIAMTLVMLDNDATTVAILIAIPMVDNRDMAVAIAVMVTVTEMHRDPVVFRHNHRIAGTVRSRERRYREKRNSPDGQSYFLHNVSPVVVWIFVTKCPCV
jgi:hypothetical protein